MRFCFYAACCLLYLGFSSLAALAADTEGKAPKAESSAVVAEVNSAQIRRADLEEELKRILGFRLGSFSDQELHFLRKKTLNKMIERELLLQKAKARDYWPKKQQLNELLLKVTSANGSESELELYLKDRGLNRSAFEEGLASDFAVTAYLHNDLFTDIEISDEQAKKAFQVNPKAFTPPEEVRVRHIMIRAPETLSADERALVRKKAEDILREARKESADFAQLARKHSEGPSKARGGDLGFFTRNQMQEIFADTAFGLEVGEISELVDTGHAIHIIQCVERRGGNPAPYAEVEDLIKDKLVREKRKARLVEHLKKLKSESKVIIYID